MIGQTIRDLRKQKRISQTELAKTLHVSQQTVTAWETGKAEPSSSAISSLADYFNVTTDFLLGRPKKINNTDENTDYAALDKALDNARSFDGEPMDDHDRDILRGILKGYFTTKK